MRKRQRRTRRYHVLGPGGGRYSSPARATRCANRIASLIGKPVRIWDRHKRTWLRDAQPEAC